VGSPDTGAGSPGESAGAGGAGSGGEGAGAGELRITGIDTAKGIRMTGGTLNGYRQVLSVFYKDAEARLSSLAAVPGEADLAAFTIHVHALKSASGSIGAEGLSKEAAGLEAAGKAGDRAAIAENLPGFYEDLERTAGEIRAALSVAGAGDGNAAAGAGGGNAGNGDGTLLDSVPFLSMTDGAVRALVQELKTALEAKDMEAIDRATGELNGTVLDSGTRQMLDAASDLLLVAKFQAAITTIHELLKE
jgi:HPt (histidine-containing phosphotransfer) domain-containing protein